MKTANKVAQTVWIVVKIILVIAAVAVSVGLASKFLNPGHKLDFFIKDIQMKWRKDPDDSPKELVDDPLTDEEIDDEIEKVRNERDRRANLNKSATG